MPGSQASIPGSSGIPLATCRKRLLGAHVTKSRELSKEVTAVMTGGDDRWWPWRVGWILKAEPTALAKELDVAEGREDSTGLQGSGPEQALAGAATHVAAGPKAQEGKLAASSGLWFSPTSRGPLSSPPTSPHARAEPALFASLWSSVL